MVKSFTLFYLVDDMNLSSDILLTHLLERPSRDDYISALLDMITIDPGPLLVSKTLENAGINLA